MTGLYIYIYIYIYIERKKAIDYILISIILWPFKCYQMFWFFVKSYCVISKEKPGNISPLFPTKITKITSMTLSDQHPRIFICSTTHYGAFPRAFFSSDALLLKNGTLSPAQRLKFWPPQVSIIDFSRSSYCGII